MAQPKINETVSGVNSPVEKTLTVLGPSTPWGFPDLRDLVSYRDLLVFFVLRDIKVRYRQTLLGAGWAILQPLLTMATMTFVFRKLIGVPSEGVPYPLFCLTGLVLWLFIARAITASAGSIVRNSQLIEKVYFPRLLVPVAAVLSGLLDLAVSLLLLFLVMVAYGRFPGPAALLCIPIAVLATVLATGVGSALAALTVRFRDVDYLVPVAIQLMLFITPVAYPTTLVPLAWRPLLAVNPATGLVELFRWSLIGTHIDPWPAFWISLLSIAVIVPAGLVVFRRLERGFADVI